MDAVKYLKAKERMFADKNCQVTRRDMKIHEEDYSELAVSIVEQWSKEHPIKTYKSEFLKLFPNATLLEDGYPTNSLRWLTGRYNESNHAQWDAEFKGWS